MFQYSGFPKHERFDRKQTLFLIELMREEIQKEEEGSPHTIAELEKRMKLGKGRKKLMWKKITERLTAEFRFEFSWEKVARKWNTLLDAYKTCVSHNKGTGNATTKFEFHKEIQSLLGERHDINFPVTASASGVVIHRQSQSVDEEDKGSKISPSTPSICKPGTNRRRKRQRSASDEEPHDILQMINDSNEKLAASIKRGTEMVVDLVKKQQASFERMFMALVQNKETNR